MPFKGRGPFTRVGPAWALPIIPWVRSGEVPTSPYVPPSPPVTTITNYYKVQLQPQIIHSVVLVDRQ
jgi:hypothetical protein